MAVLGNPQYIATSLLLLLLVTRMALGSQHMTSAMYHLAGENQAVWGVESLSSGVSCSVSMCGLTCLQEAECAAFTWTQDTGMCVTNPAGGVVVSSPEQKLYLKDGMPAPTAGQSCSADEVTTTSSCSLEELATRAGLKVFNNLTLLFDTEFKEIFVCTYGALVGEEAPNACTYVSQGSGPEGLFSDVPSNLDAALPLIKATEDESRYLLFSGSKVYCYKITLNDDPDYPEMSSDRVNCVDEGRNSSEDTLITELFGAGIPSDLDAAMAANWDDTNTHQVWFLKNNKLWKATHGDPGQTVVKYSDEGQVQDLLGGNHCDVTAVITGRNQGECIFLRGSYVTLY